jgi:hypothetical protein
MTGITSAKKHLPFILTACLVGLSGCVFWRSASLTSNDDSPTLTLELNAAGVVLTGPCMAPWVGKFKDPEYVIKLNGVKERYSASEFEITDSFQRTWKGSEEMNGLIFVDRNSRTVFIDVFLKGKPFERNGRHHYKIKAI